MVISMNGSLKAYYDGRNIELVIAAQESKGNIFPLSAIIY